MLSTQLPSGSAAECSWLPCTVHYTELLQTCKARSDVRSCPGTLSTAMAMPFPTPFFQSLMCGACTIRCSVVRRSLKEIQTLQRRQGCCGYPGCCHQGRGKGIKTCRSELRVQRRAPAQGTESSSLPASFPPCRAVSWAEQGLQAAIRHKALVDTNLWPDVRPDPELAPQVQPSQQTDVLPEALSHSRCLRWVSRQRCRARPVGLLGLAGGKQHGRAVQPEQRLCSRCEQVGLEGRAVRLHGAVRKGRLISVLCKAPARPQVRLGSALPGGGDVQGCFSSCHWLSLAVPGRWVLGGTEFPSACLGLVRPMHQK